MQSQIIEIGFEIKCQEDFDFLESLLNRIQIPYYVEPTRAKPYTSLEELECDCEGK